MATLLEIYINFFFCLFDLSSKPLNNQKHRNDLSVSKDHSQAFKIKIKAFLFIYLL